MIKIFSADEQYRDSIISLWQEAFGDSEEYVSFFLDECPSYDVVGYFIDNQLVSMFFLLEGTIKNYKCKYLYAACTATEHRKKGIMEKLISFARNYCVDNGYDGIFLVPANEKLYSYYSKFGFIPSFKKSVIRLNSCDFKNLNPEIKNQFETEQIVNAKISILEKLESFCFERKTLEYTIKEHLFNGGKVFYNNDNDSQTLVFYHTSDDIITVKEYLNSDNEFEPDYCKQILNNNAHNVYILCPLVYNREDIVEEYAKCGMCLPLNSIFEAYIRSNTTIYAGMYLD